MTIINNINKLILPCWRTTSRGFAGMRWRYPNPSSHPRLLVSTHASFPPAVTAPCIVGYNRDLAARVLGHVIHLESHGFHVVCLHKLGEVCCGALRAHNVVGIRNKTSRACRRIVLNILQCETANRAETKTCQMLSDAPSKFWKRMLTPKKMINPETWRQTKHAGSTPCVAGDDGRLC